MVWSLVISIFAGAVIGFVFFKLGEKRGAVHTFETIISLAQAEEIVSSRKLLFDMEDDKAISKIPASKWQDDWKRAARRVSQAFNSAGVIVRLDKRLEKIWVRQTRRSILKSWWIAQPYIQERHKRADDLWEGFNWLAKEARQYCKPGELEEWISPEGIQLLDRV